MIAVIFEVVPAEGRESEYLMLAAALKEELAVLDGFVSVERFRSMSDERKLLSLSFFRDEDAVRAWRNTTSHRATQARGRSSVFEDYRLRVVEVLRDYGMSDRREAPADSGVFHEPPQKELPSAMSVTAQWWLSQGPGDGRDCSEKQQDETD